MIERYTTTQQDHQQKVALKGNVALSQLKFMLAKSFLRTIYQKKIFFQSYE